MSSISISISVLVSSVFVGVSLSAIVDIIVMVMVMVIIMGVIGVNCEIKLYQLKSTPTFVIKDNNKRESERENHISK